ncbi:phosphoglycerate kinase [Candidatus Bathyarchaeota archaeon]|nr:phosphoglycerate kinase [Candidatus Bathyarchaeota archaeon]
MRNHGFLTMDDFDFRNKTVILRVDFNSPLDEAKRITDDSRIRMHVPTIRELMDKGAKVVILSHQGRPGDPDFSTLQEHAQRLSQILGRPIGYVDDVYGERAKAAIEHLKPGDVLVLENVRTIPEETAKMKPEDFAKTEFIRRLASLADAYVNDGFAVAHRANASVVGFPIILPAFAGRLMESELKALERARKAEEKPCIYILGGAKSEDAAAISEYVLSHRKADFIITGGVVGQLFLHAKGFNLGEPNRRFLEARGFLQYVLKIRSLFQDFPDRILTPEDFGVEVFGKRRDISLEDLPTPFPILDIGPRTVESYAKVIRDSRIIVLSGPMGVYERSDFMLGTKGVFEAVAMSKAFSVVGGGNTIEALEKLGLRERVGYISSGGGALMEFLTGKVLPGVEALEKAAERWRKKT